MFVYNVFGKRMYFLLLLYFDSAVKYNFFKIFYPDSIDLFKLFRYGKHLRLGLIRYFLSLNVPKKYKEIWYLSPELFYNKNNLFTRHKLLLRPSTRINIKENKFEILLRQKFYTSIH